MTTQQDTSVITLYSLEKELKELIDDELIDRDTDEFDDILWEMAESCCPIYTADLLRVAMDSNWLLLVKPEWECDNALVYIQANIISHLVKCGRGYIDQRA